MKRKYMNFSRLLMLVLTFAMPLSAFQENKKAAGSAKLYSDKNGCISCSSCRTKPSAAELTLAVEAVLNNGLLLLPQLQPQLIALLQQIIANAAASGTVIGVGGVSGLYVYNLSDQSVAVEGDITFDTNGFISPGFAHTPGSPSILVTAAGVIQLDFSVSGTEPNQFSVFQNGTLVPGTIYGSGAGTQQNFGQVIFTVNAGDTLTIRNHSSVASVGLATPIGGTQASVNASVAILRLSS